jgi:hypothetical protein
VYPFEAVTGEVEGAKEGRSEAKGMYGCTDIVMKTGQGQFPGPGTSTDCFSRLKEKNRPAFPRYGDSRSQSVGTGTDHHGIVVVISQGEPPCPYCFRIVCPLRGWAH